TVRSSLLCTTVSSRLRKTTKPLARPSRSLPGIRQTFSSWSRTQRRTPRPAGGDTVTSARTVHLAATRCSRLAPPATRRLFAILSSPVTHVDGMVTHRLARDSAALRDVDVFRTARAANVGRAQQAITYSVPVIEAARGDAR